MRGITRSCRPESVLTWSALAPSSPLTRPGSCRFAIEDAGQCTMRVVPGGAGPIGRGPESTSELGGRCWTSLRPVLGGSVASGPRGGDSLSGGCARGLQGATGQVLLCMSLTGVSGWWNAGVRTGQTWLAGWRRGGSGRGLGERLKHEGEDVGGGELGESWILFPPHH